MINTPIQHAVRPSARPSIGFDIDKLDALLMDLENEHHTLLDLAGLQREAIVKADPKVLGKVVEETAQTLTRIAGIERTRQQVIKQPDGSIPTVNQITDELKDQHDHEHAQALSSRSASLRELMQRVKEEHEAVRLATLALSNHMNGLMEQISAKLSHSGTSGRRGSVDPGRSQVISSLDTVQ